MGEARNRKLEIAAADATAFRLSWIVWVSVGHRRLQYGSSSLPRRGARSTKKRPYHMTGVKAHRLRPDKDELHIFDAIVDKVFLDVNDRH